MQQNKKYSFFSYITFFLVNQRCPRYPRENLTDTLDIFGIAGYIWNCWSQAEKYKEQDPEACKFTCHNDRQ